MIKTLPNNFRVILSRTDSIGDVVLTLPMAGLIKKHYPECRIFFLGSTYTRDVVLLSKFIDGFINYDDLQKLAEQERALFLNQHHPDIFVHVFPKKDLAWLAKRASVPLRAGTTNRLYHWLTCNKLPRLSRKHSELHESQLNLKLLDVLNIKEAIALKEMSKYYGFTKVPALERQYETLLDPNKQNVILHPRSKGSGKEWGLDNFAKLIKLLPTDSFKIFISGTPEEAVSMAELLKNNDGATNIIGKMKLDQFIAFINRCDALVAASTGPLHIAAALGKKAIGLFSSRRPIHPGRWMPLGEKGYYLVNDENCLTCKSGKDCDCIQQIQPSRVVELLSQE